MGSALPCPLNSLRDLERNAFLLCGTLILKAMEGTSVFKKDGNAGIRKLVRKKKIIFLSSGLSVVNKSPEDQRLCQLYLGGIRLACRNVTVEN